MTSFDADTLGALRELREVGLRTDKHPQSAVVIWVVVADDGVFVRSFRGAKGRWYRDLAGGGPATLEFAGRRLAVQAVPANDAAAIEHASREYPEEVWAGSLRDRDGAARNPGDHAAARPSLKGNAAPVGRVPPAPRYSSFTPTRLMRACPLAASPRSWVANSAGLLSTTSDPSPSSALRNAGSFKASARTV